MMIHMLKAKMTKTLDKSLLGTNVMKVSQFGTCSWIKQDSSLLQLVVTLVLVFGEVLLEISLKIKSTDYKNLKTF